MKAFFVFLIVTALSIGCATRPTTDELMAEAYQCVLEYNENGIIKEAPKEYRDECWAAAEKSMEIDDRREERRQKHEAEAAMAKFCRDQRMILACNHWGNCGCISYRDLQRIFRGM